MMGTVSGGNWPISVILAGRREDAGARRSLALLGSQTWQGFEIVWVEQGNGGAPAAPADLNVPEDRLQLISSPGSVAEGWNAGACRAGGRSLCFLRPGDELDRLYLEKCAFLLRACAPDVCASWEETPEGLRRAGGISGPAPLWREVCTSAAVIGAEAFHRAGGFDPRAPASRWMEDLGTRLAKAGGTAYVIPEALVRTGRAAEAAAAGLETGLGDGSWAGRPRGSPASACAAPGRSGPGVQWKQSGTPPAVLLAMPYLKEGGAERSLSLRCRQLRALGFEILIVTTAASRNSPGDTTGWFSPHTAGIYHLPRFLEPRLWREFVFHLLYEHSIRAIWQAGSSYMYDLLPQIRKLFPGIAVVDVLFNPTGHTGDHLKYRQFIDHVVVEHEGMKQWLLEHGERESRISVIPNGLELREWQPQERRDWHSGQARPPGPPYVIGFFGRLSREKAPRLFLEIAQLLFGRGDVEFLLCGSGPLEAELRLLRSERGLDAAVHMPGFVKVRDYLPCCDVTVVCSRLEGRPNIVMESLAMGIPVVASRTGGIPEMAPEGEGIRLCGADDAADFCGTIAQLLDDRAEYTRVAARGRRWAETHFSAQAGGSSYAALLGNLAERCGTRGPAPTQKQVLACSEFQSRLTPDRRSPSALGALARFGISLISPQNVPGNIRTLWLYWKVRRSRQALAELWSLVDAGQYANVCPDAKVWKMPLLWHYLWCGFRQTYDPSPRFNTSYYLTLHRDVARTGVNPLLHYVAAGRAEGRACQPDYDLE